MPLPPSRRSGLQPEADYRAQGRSNVFLSAVLVAGSAPIAVRVRNLSVGGALLDGASIPPAGEKVRLLRGALTAHGEIAWRSDSQAGVCFTEDIKVAQWVERVGHPGQQRVDDAIAAMRRREPLQTDGGDPVLPSLGTISAELDTICERLACSSPMSVELAEQLVKLDALARMLQQIASRSQPSS
jgi:hypothetical protein